MVKLKGLRASGLIEVFKILRTESLQLLYACLAANIFKPGDFVRKCRLAYVTTDGHIQPFSVVFVQNCIIKFLFPPSFSKVIDRE